MVACMIEGKHAVYFMSDPQFKYAKEGSHSHGRFSRSPVERYSLGNGLKTPATCYESAENEKPDNLIANCGVLPRRSGRRHCPRDDSLTKDPKCL